MSWDNVVYILCMCGFRKDTAYIYKRNNDCAYIGTISTNEWTAAIYLEGDEDGVVCRTQEQVYNGCKTKRQKKLERILK